MTSDAFGLESDPGWLLGDLVDRVGGARSAVLLSADGLVIAEYGLGRDAADLMAPLAAGLCGIARTIGATFGGGDGVRQVVAELDAALVSVSSAGYGSVLAVLAGREADAGVLGYEMTQLVKSVAPFLAARPRRRGMVTHGEGSARQMTGQPNFIDRTGTSLRATLNPSGATQSGRSTE